MGEGHIRGSENWHQFRGNSYEGMHHGFHGSPLQSIVGMLIVVLLGFLLWRRFRTHKQNNWFANIDAATPTVSYQAPLSHKANMLDEWERNIHKEEKSNGDF
ncbi:hypothetical protein SAMN04487897_104157 [Paenibacillus sp. yr247]|uniref:hypothetical protein n=1 Tax=Paenibacillus sp. yr247 TaxID=1761880 RepID=UPI00087E931F|nr:hypothetical protein [Paenibacillus sp. yr247]SDN70888.1 hypothetical protein SAMN04487897_104157 [Paenibacillus sp. yr247]